MTGASGTALAYTNSESHRKLKRSSPMSPHPVIAGRLGSSNAPAMKQRFRSGPSGLRRSAEAMLKEMAFVLHATRSLKAAITEREASYSDLPSARHTCGEDRGR